MDSSQDMHCSSFSPLSTKARPAFEDDDEDEDEDDLIRHLNTLLRCIRILAEGRMNKIGRRDEWCVKRDRLRRTSVWKTRER